MPQFEGITGRTVREPEGRPFAAGCERRAVLDRRFAGRLASALEHEQRSVRPKRAVLGLDIGGASDSYGVLAAIGDVLGEFLGGWLCTTFFAVQKKSRPSRRGPVAWIVGNPDRRRFFLFLGSKGKLSARNEQSERGLGFVVAG